MEKLKNKLCNWKNVLTIILVAICIAIIASASMFKTKITIDQNQAAEELYAGGGLTSDQIIVQACKMLGRSYGWGIKGTKGLGAVYGLKIPDLLEPEDIKDANNQPCGVDCSGLVYWTLSKLGVNTQNSEFAHNNPVPIDTFDWLCTKKYYNTYWSECGNKGKTGTRSVFSNNVNLTYTYGGNTYNIKVLKAEDGQESLKYYQYKDSNGNIQELPAGTIVISNARALWGKSVGEGIERINIGDDGSYSFTDENGQTHYNKLEDHMWITLGDLGTTDANEVKEILKSMGVNEDLLRTTDTDGKKATIVSKSNTCTYWRIESAGGVGTYINNEESNVGARVTGVNGKVKGLGPIWAFQMVYEIKGDYKLSVEKFDNEGNKVDINQDTFSISENGNSITPLNINGNTIKLEKKLDNVVANGTVIDRYVIKETNAPNGLLPFDKEIEVDICVQSGNNKKYGTISSFLIDGKELDSKIGTYSYGDYTIKLSEQDSNIVLQVYDVKPEGQYEVNINKVDAQGKQLKGSNFSADIIKQNNGGDYSFEGPWKAISLKEFNGSFELDKNNFKITSEKENDVIRINETNVPNGYQLLNKEVVLQVVKKLEGDKFVIDYVNVFAFGRHEAFAADTIVDATNQNSHFVAKLDNATKECIYNVENSEDKFKVSLSDDMSTINVEAENKKIDLALKKTITKINGIKAVKSEENTSYDENQNRFLDNWLIEAYECNPETYAEVSPLEKTTNADYYMNKNPIEVNVGDEVEFAIRIFNEGDVKAKASKINDYIPKGLRVTSVKYQGNDIDYTVSDYRVLSFDLDFENNYIAPYNRASKELSYDEVIVTCVVENDATGILTNVAEIMEYKTRSGVVANDIDSTSGNWKAENNEDKLTNDKSSEAWKNYQNEILSGWSTKYIAQDESITNMVGDDDDFEKLIIKGKAKLRIGKVDNNNDDVDAIKFDITKDGENTETNLVIDATSKRIEKEFEIKPIGEQETIYEIKEQENNAYIQLLGPIEIKVVSKAGKLQGYYFKYNNGATRSTEMETENTKKFTCVANNGMNLEVNVTLDVANSVIDVVIKNILIQDNKYGVLLKKVSSADMETPLSGVTFKGTKQIGGASAEAIKNTQGTEGLVTGADGFTETIKTTMNIDTYSKEDIYVINEIDLGGNSGVYTKYNGSIKVKAFKKLNNYKPELDYFEIFADEEKIADTSSKNKGSVIAKDSTGKSFPMNYEIKTDASGMKYLQISFSNLPNNKFNLFINKLDKETGLPITEDGTEIKVYKATANGDVFVNYGPVRNGLLQVEDSLKADTTSVFYKIYEEKAAANYKNVFGNKYIGLQVQLSNGVPTSTQAAIYLDNEELENDELLDYIDSSIATRRVNDQDVRVVDVTIENPQVEKKIDLALKKVITQINLNGEYKDVKSANGFEQKYDRLTNERIDSSDLATAPNHDAKYYLNKTPILVVKGAKIKYQIRIYNESNEEAATASEIVDYLPKGLKLVKNGNNYAVYYRDETTPIDSSEVSYNETTNTLRVTALKNKPLIPVYDAQNDKLSSEYITVECIVEDAASGILTNMAEIGEYKTNNKIIDKDYDSESGNWKNPVDDNSANNESVDRTKSQWRNYIGSKDNRYAEGEYKNYIGQEDDDDFEKIEVAEIDLALKKIITKINDNPESSFEDDYKRFQEGKVVTNTKNLDGNSNYKTANYFLNKTPIEVGINDIVTYQIRIYNEGSIDATASKIVDYIPKGLTLAKENDTYCVYYKDETTPLASSNYSYNENTNVLEITKLKDELIPRYDIGSEEVHYSYVTVKCVVNDSAMGYLNNVAEIAKYKTVFGETDTDRDSSTTGNGEWKSPNGSNKNTLDGKFGDAWARYYNNIKNGAFEDYPGQEDDDDFEKIYVKSKVSVKLKKISKIDNTKSLEGIKFDIDGEEKTTDENGIIDIGTFDIENSLKTISIQERISDKYVEINKPIFMALQPKLLEQGGYGLNGYYINFKAARPEACPHIVQIPSETTFTIHANEYDETVPGASVPDPDLVGFVHDLKVTVKVYENPDIKNNYNVELIIENTPYNTFYDLLIKKIDEKDNTLKDVKFKTQADNKYNYFDQNELVTDEDGNAYVGKYIISADNYNDVDTIKIKEIETTYKHYVLPNDLFVTVKKGLKATGDGYEVKNIKLTYGEEGEESYKESIEGKNIQIDGVKVIGSNKTVTIKARLATIQNAAGYKAQRVVITIENKEKIFDLSLRKFIIKDEDKEITRWSKNPVDTSALVNDDSVTTAVYNNAKEPIIEVHLRDRVQYGIRVFNEGELNGYAEYVIDDIPDGLQMIVPGDGSGETSELNKKYRWKMYRLCNEKETAQINYDGKGYIETTDPELAEIIGTDYLSKAHGEEIMAENDGLNNPFLMEAFNPEKMDIPDNRTVEVEFKVAESAVPNTIIENKAQIYRHADETGDTKIIDIDSTPGKWIEEDDDQDIERILVLRDKEYDLSLRKFITKVNDKEMKVSREPVVDCTKLLNGGTTADKKHTKDPVLVKPEDVVEYTIRVYNEGKDDAYAETIIDDVPKGTQMIAPEYDEDGKPLNMNAEYGWVMYRLATEEEIKNVGLDSNISYLNYDGKLYVNTENAEEAVIIVSDYLSYRRDAVKNLIRAFNPLNKEMKPENYRDVKVQYTVCGKDKIVTDKDLINYAQIGSMSDETGNTVVIDIDSTPGIWIETDDDQDIEKLRVGYFDLALYKWVTAAVVTEDGKTTEYPSQHTELNKAKLVNVSIPKNKLNKVTVKFKYQIKVVNEGTVQGKALEITDHLPEGLKFVEEDNKEFRWKQKEDGTIVTDYLKDTILNPGESAEVTVVAVWVNGANNLGKKVNYAEISKDENKYGWEDIDSKPGNFDTIPREDDEDGDEVLLQVRTGANAIIYVLIGLAVLVIVAIGTYGVKKYVINKY